MHLQVPESLLDKVEIVSLEHARKIMDIVCQLAYSGHAQAEMLQSDINILIQKQLRSLVTPLVSFIILFYIYLKSHFVHSGQRERELLVL